MTTPKRLVHWALDISLSELGSPYSEGSSSDSISSISSLQYINSQLIAHGYTQSPGICLDGLAKSDMDRVVKCLLGMLSQRVDDLSRTEDFVTKIRTLSYDNERIMSMYRAATEKAANAEREMNMHKSRMTTLQRTLQSTEQAHKHTTAELQRTRTSLQAVRTAHQTEIKKLEKEKERMADRWSKLSEGQLKSSSMSGTMRASNFEVVEASDVQLRGKGAGFLETALEEAQQARKDLFDQNRKLRGLVVSTANEIQHVQHVTSTSDTMETVEEPPSWTSMALFPTPGTEVAGDKIDSLLTSLRQSVTRLTRADAQTGSSALTGTTASTSKEVSKAAGSAEIDRLQAVIDTLRTELEQAQKLSSQYADEIQKLFDRYAEEQRAERHDVADVSVDLMTVPARDEQQQRLEARFQELAEERQKFTEAAVRLGKEKAALEAERIKFLEEKRTWQVETMLAELPPTPAVSSSPLLASHLPPEPESVPPVRSPRRVSRKVGGSVAVGKAGNNKKARHSRRSSGFGAGATLGPSSPKKVIPSFETEVIPSPSKQMPAFTLSQAPLAAPVFVFPPPSPAPPGPAEREHPKVPPAKLAASQAVSEPAPSTSTTSSSSSASSSSEPASAAPVPNTPILRRPFPMAKPMVPGMVHAYSPVKPSPLSRILMLANSPDSPEDIPRLGALAEEDETDELEVSPTPMASVLVPNAPPLKSLAAELGVSEDEDDPPKYKKVVRTTVKTRSSQAAIKGKAAVRTGAKTVARPGEKENTKRAKTTTLGTSRPAPSGHEERKPSRPVSKPAATSYRPGATTSKLVPGKGGARRVPIDSAEAAPVGPAWRG